MGEARMRRMLAGQHRMALFEELPPEHLRFPDWAHGFVKDYSRLQWARLTDDGTAALFRHVVSHMTVIVSGLVEGDGKRWLHVSMAHGDRLPSWADLKTVKETFIGSDRKAIQVLPSDEEYVNCHPYCLHLWHCLDGDGLPDFTHGRPKGML